VSAPGVRGSHISRGRVGTLWQTAEWSHTVGIRDAVRSHRDVSSAIRKLSRNGLMRSAGKRFPRCRQKLSRYGRIPHLLIALRSPNALLKTGLRMCLLEKSQDSTAFDAEQSVLYGPVCLGIIAKYGHYSRISAQSQRKFSAVQTAWRRGLDSNPRYRSETCKIRYLRKLHGIN
jgi:hypothetical protein